MSSADPWDNMTPPPVIDFPAHKFLFDSPGTTLIGTVSMVREANFPDGSSCPEIWLVDKESIEWQVTCGPAGLQQLLFEQRPKIGDLVAVQYIGTTKLASGNTKKGFKLQVKRGNGTAPVVAPAAAAPAPLAVVAPAPEPAPALVTAENDLFAGATVVGGGSVADDDLFG